MKKILVTGGAGYIGSHTVVALYESGFTPILVDNFSNSDEKVLDALEKLLGHKPKAYKADVCDPKVLQKIWSAESPDAVIHFAANKAVGESVEKPLMYYRNNVDSLLSVLEVMKNNDCESIVFSSSCTVYGDPDICPVTEQTAQKPATSPYGATKQMCERILKDVSATSVNVVALRYFNPVGAHPSGLIGELPLGTPNNLIPYLTQAVAGIRNELTVFGNDYDTPDGTCIRDYIHVMDLAEAHVAAINLLSKSEISFEAINIGTGKGNSVQEVINAFESVTGLKVPYKFGPRRAGDVVKIWSDVSYAHAKLDWKANKTLEDSMRDAWNWQDKLTK